MATPTNVFALHKRVRARLRNREESLAYPRTKLYTFELFNVSFAGQRLHYARWQEPLLTVCQAYDPVTGEPQGSELRISCIDPTLNHIPSNRLHWMQAHKLATHTEAEAYRAMAKYAR